MNPIAGKRILVVEDEALIAAMLEHMLVELGAVIIGPVATLAEGLLVASSAQIDAAVLDVNVRGGRIDALAVALRDRGIPLVFATGYGKGAHDIAQQSPLIDKPYTQERLTSVLTLVLANRQEP